METSAIHSQSSVLDPFPEPGDHTMKVYTYSEARRQLASVLDEAEQAGEVHITRRDGSTFTLRPIERGSPLDGIEPVEGANVSLDDIMDSIREGRARGYEDLP